MAMYRVFLDGSCFDGEDRLLTLGAVIGPDEIWPEFRKTWRSLLGQFELTSFHSADAIAGRGAFVGWKTSEVHGLFNEIGNLFQKFGTSGFCVKSCTVNLVDHEKAKATLFGLKDPEAICIDVCCGSSVQVNESLMQSQTQIALSFCFDRNERFLRFFDSAWRKRRKKLDKGGWPQQVKEIYPASAEQETVLQAADFVAWNMNAFHRKNEHGLLHAFELHFLGPHWHYDYETICTEYSKGRIKWNEEHIRIQQPSRRFSRYRPKN